MLQVTIALQDDPDSGSPSCYNAVKDCYDWQPSSANGVFSWTWVSYLLKTTIPCFPITISDLHVPNVRSVRGAAVAMAW